MVNLEDVKTVLISNPYLTNDIKYNLMDLIVIFNKNFPSVNLGNLLTKLKTLKVNKGSKYLVKSSSLYNPVDNEILINANNLNEVDVKHLLMRELLNVISSNKNFTGFNMDNNYEALNIGYTEILTNFLVGNDHESEYEDEVVATNMIATIVGNDNLLNAYFNNDAAIFLKMVC